MARSALSVELQDLYESLREISDGDLATYIPPLADADPSLFGLAIVTVDGHCYSAGDTTTPFTIQSVSKPFVFGLALDDLGVDDVVDRGSESSRPAIRSTRSAVDEGTRPAVQPDGQRRRDRHHAASSGRPPRSAERIRSTASGASPGATLEVDEVVFDPSSSTGDRNRAIAYLMRSVRDAAR